tara:strand:- start:692 stop:913 length:222 start_codon:yes stop_codon:yes gene_type:complete
MTNKQLYVNPLGAVKEIDYNNTSQLKNSVRTVNARVDDSKLRNKSHHIQLSMWSISAGISIIAFLLLIRGVTK